MSTTRKQTLTLVLLCIVLRLFFFLLVQPWQAEVRDNIIVRSEAKLFHDLALGIKERGEFGYEDSGELEALRMPGHPAFLAIVYSIFGVRPWVALLVQILLEAATCVLLYRLIAARINPNVGFTAAILYAVDPLLIRLSSSLLTDLLFAFVLVVAFYVVSATLARKEEHGRTWRFALAGLLFGVATLIRPVGQYVPLAMLFLFILFYRPQWKLILKYFVVIAVGFMIVISPWMARNQRAFGRAQLSTSGPYGLIVLHIFPMVWKENPRLTHREMKNQLLAEADSLMARDGFDPRTANAFEKSDYWTKVGVRYIADDPVAFVVSYMVGLYRLFAIIGAQAYLNMLDHPSGALRYVIAGVVALHLLLTYLSALIGVIVAWRRYDRVFLALSLTLALYFIVLTGPAGISRYKVPAIPFYLVFSGIGLLWLVEWGRARLTRRA